jgi:Flp pilus assembly protein TadG
MMRIAKRARDGERGAVAVEFAMVIPLLLLLLLGVIDFGRAMYVKNSLVYAASQGARVAAIHSSNWSAVANQAVTDLNIPRLAGTTGSESATVTSTAACPADAAASADTATVSVTVSIPFHWITPVGILPSAGSINSLNATATWLCVKSKFA